MSREYLSDVLDKFAQITTILVETSKIKEYLDTKCVNDSDLNLVLEKTKTEVENLAEHSVAVKNLFYKQYKEVSAELNSVNGKITEEEKNETASQTPDDSLASDTTPDISLNQIEAQSKADKPLIKLVDINKLVEPKTLLKKEFSSPVKAKKSVEFDSTVVIITSSSSEEEQTLKSCTSIKTSDSRRTIRSRRRAAKETLKKTRTALQALSSASSDEDVVKVNKVKNGNRRKAKLDEKMVLSATSSSLSDNSSNESSGKLSDGVKKKKKQIAREETDLSWKDDPKFNAKCYVKVLRVPCEKLKEYYLEKLELLQIERLNDLSSLKRKRRKNSGTEKSSDSDKEQEKKKTKKTKENNNSNEDSSSDDEIIVNKSNDLEAGKIQDASKEDTTNDLFEKDKNEADDKAKREEEKTLEADLAMDMLHSDTDDNKTSSEEEEINKNKEDSENNKEKDSDKEVMDDSKTDSDLAKDTTVNGEKVDKDNEDRDNDEVEGETDRKSEKSDKEKSSDEEKKKEKEEKDNLKKDWRKDKLLTMKLSSTDTEEEMEKYRKKRENTQQADVLSDDEQQIIRSKKKRMVKKRVKKAILSDSDNDEDKRNDEGFEKPSESSSSDSEREKEEEEEETKKPARKRVKRVKDSSDDDDPDKSTRKQIRHILGKDSLAETTKQAEAEERERKARIAEKQKKYNQIYEANAALNAKVEKVVLDIDGKTNTELLKVDEDLVSKLKPHQASGIQFMWDACFESLERAKTTVGSGCILAHCMGLGKTLQVIALTHTLLVNSEQTKVNKVMVVSPLNTVLNWVNEYKQWLPDEDDFDVYELVSCKQNYERLCQVKNWDSSGGVLIIGYDMFRNLSNPDNKRLSKSMRQSFQKALVDPGPDLVVCDEGHLLKNEKTNLSIAMNRLRTLRRIVLTGTPLQNNLKEYFCMVQFIKPNLLGTYKEYLNRFVNPITNGQYTDSTPHDIQVMRRRSHVLHKMLDGVVQRRDYSVLQPYLPPKYEYVLFLNLSEVQIKLYSYYMEHFAKRSLDGSNRTSFLFVDFQNLQRICTHPRVLLDRSIEMKSAKEKDFSEDESEGSIKDFINDDEDEETSSSGSNSKSDSENDEEKTKTTAQRKRLTRAQAALAKENGDEEPFLVEDVREKEWWQEYCDGDELNVIGHSSKILLLFEILKECEQIGDKVLVFSQSLYSLNVIEYFLGRVHDATQLDQTDTVGGYSGSWCLGLDYFRLDGSSSCDNRTSWCKTFNDPSNTRARLFLISTKAGGLGINLVAANRVIIFDVSWNPSHDVQSIYRVYRFGQTKPCYIYRFVTYGTMEMKIYERQVIKQSISKRVIDEQQIDRHYNQNDLAELYKFDPNPEGRPIPLVPKDVLLGELLQQFENRIYKYHEHQSLLENKEEEGLNEEERKAAWEEFENEKKQRFNTGMNNVFRAPFMETALMNIVRKENPSWNDTQVSAMVPALLIQLQETLSRGDFTFYRRVQQEMQILQALQNQKLKEQYYHQQALKLLQQQQMANTLRGQNPGRFIDQYINQIPGSSRGVNQLPNMFLNSNEIIDLND